MRISELRAELRRRNSALYYFGWFNIVLLIVASIGIILDDTVITGINAWIKPAKFAISVSIYSWTFAWLLNYLPHSKQVKWITGIIILCMFVENAAIFMQAYRGVRSHFNISTAFDGALFGIMGIFILINTITLVWVQILFFTKGIKLSTPMLIAWRAGIFLFIIGGISGGIMSGTLTHTVGAADGGPGLPFFDWSTVVGDLRLPHFFTLHGLQAMAIFGWWSSKRSASAWPILFFFLGYSLFCILLHVIVLSGKSPF